MSKITFAIAAAAAGVATGAAATAAFYSSKKAEPVIATTTTTTTTSPAAAGSSRTGACPPSPSPFPPSSVSSQKEKPYPFPVDPNGLFQYGFPGPIADLRPATSLTSSFDRRTRNPAWVAEHITPLSLAANNADRKHSIFTEDASIPEKFRAKLKDYFRSGYDRGHQVPAADAKWSQDAMDDTFLLSNMCPQVGDGFNRDYWAHFEDFCRRLTTTYPSVRVVTGPLYLPKRDGADGKWRVSYEVIGTPPNVAVPTHFFKVIYGEEQPVGAGIGAGRGKVALAAFVLPNTVIDSQKPLTDFEVPVEAVERASGLEFVPRLPANQRKKLCEEVRCSVIIKDYKERQKTFANPQFGR